MEINREWPIRIIAWLLIVALVSPVAYAHSQDQAVQEEEQRGTDKLPDSPGASQAQLGQNSSQQPSSQQVSPKVSTSMPSPNQQVSMAPQGGTQSPSGTAASQQPETHQPLGTAAAESIPTMGIAASQPAGAAVAPAKQRRVRTILIRVGAVVGIAAAVGVTVALSEGSPSRPPGAH
jgi:hypothetical protein